MESLVYIESILNQLYRHKSFIYTRSSLEKIEGTNILVLDIEPQKNDRRWDAM